MVLEFDIAVQAQLNCISRVALGENCRSKNELFRVSSMVYDLSWDSFSLFSCTSQDEESIRILH